MNRRTSISQRKRKYTSLPLRLVSDTAAVRRGLHTLSNANRYYWFLPSVPEAKANQIIGSGKLRFQDCAVGQCFPERTLDARPGGKSFGPRPKPPSFELRPVSPNPDS